MAAAIFMGFGASALDSKGRFTLPAAFRNPLGQQCSSASSMLVRSDGGRPYLTLFGDLQAPDFQAKFESQAGNVLDSEDVFAKFWMGIQPVTIDSGGRFALPAGHARHAGITDGIFLVGAGPQVQLWDPQRFLDSKVEHPVVVDACTQFIADLAKKRGGKS